MKDSKLVVVAAALAAASLASACTNSSTKTETTSTTATSSASTEAAAPAANGTKPAAEQETSKDAKSDQTKSADAQKPGAAKPAKPNNPSPLAESMPLIQSAQKHIDLAHMPDAVMICTVDGTPLTLADYRRAFKIQEEQVRAHLSMSPGLQKELVDQAKQDKLELSAKEKKQLIDTAHKAISATGGVLENYLKQSHMTPAQFDQQVLDMGLAVKAADHTISQSLLQQLVDRELICQAARASGFSSGAFNKYTQFKTTAEYKSLVKTGMNPDQIKDETIKAALTQMQVEKIEQESPVTDKEIQDFYDKNKSKFKHGERIRLSQIVIAAPKSSNMGLESLEDQVKKQEPKLKPDEVQAKVKLLEQQKRQTAEQLLQRALKGEDFASLANQYTDDIAEKAAKMGGDVGWQDKKNLVKSFADKIWPVKVGQVCPEVIDSPLGFHIFKVVDKQPEGIMELAEVKDALHQALDRKNKVEAVQNWLAHRRDTAKIALSPEFQQLVSAPAANSKERQAD